MNPIRRSVRLLKAYTPGEQPKARGVIKLNTNENPYPPSPKVAAALRGLNAERLRLYPDPVSADLRRRIARMHACAMEQVFVGNGSDEVLALCARAFVERYGAVGYFEPSYSLYPVLAAIEGLRTKPVPLSRDFSWTMPSGYRASLFFLTDPNAPTSLSFPRPRVAAFCREFRGVVLIDEAYADFARGNCMDLALRRNNVIVCRSLSKSYSLAGLRVGYAVGPRPLIAALYKIKDSYNVSLIAQKLALAALSDVPYMRRNVKRIVATRERVAGVLRTRGFEVPPSDTNFLWVRPPAGSARRVFEALRERNIFVRHFPGPRTGEYLRITVGTARQMRALLRVLCGQKG
jgi:histidinol-phosphate aminotransferase